MNAYTPVLGKLSRSRSQDRNKVGLRSSNDGPLLNFPQTAFDVFVTIDRKLEHQQNLKKLQLGVVVVHVQNNELSSHRPLFGALLRAAETVTRARLIRLRV